MRGRALAIAFTFVVSLIPWPGRIAFALDAQHQVHSPWKIIKPAAPGPFTDAASELDGKLWLSSRAVAGFIRVDGMGNTEIVHTPGFIPRYLAYNVLDRSVYATSWDEPRAIGALNTTSGQLTIYILPQNDPPMPPSQIVIGDLNWIYFAGRAEYGFLTPEILNFLPYPSGLTTNSDISATSDSVGDFWATECCLNGAASLAELTTGYQHVEFPLSPDCARPAGMTLGQDTNLYIACATQGSGATIIAFSVTGGELSATSLPFSYTTRVNSMTTGRPFGERLLYLAPGTSPALWSYATQGGTLTRLPTPDGSVPTAVKPYGNDTVAIAGSQLDIYRGR